MKMHYHIILFKLRVKYTMAVIIRIHVVYEMPLSMKYKDRI